MLLKNIFKVVMSSISERCNPVKLLVMFNNSINLLGLNFTQNPEPNSNPNSNRNNPNNLLDTIILLGYNQLLQRSDRVQ